MKGCGRIQWALAVAIIAVAATLLAAGGVRAQTDGAPIAVYLTFTETSYNLDAPGETISATIEVYNPSSTASVWTKDGFSTLGYHLFMIFEDPDRGILITSTSGAGGSSPTPFLPPGGVDVEELGEGWSFPMPIPEVRDYYPLIEGQFDVSVRMVFIQYDPAYAVDTDGDGKKDYVPYVPPGVPPAGAVLWQGDVQSNTFPLTLTTEVAAVSSPIRVRVTEYSFGEGNHPGVTKRPLENIQVRLYKKSDIEASGPPISPINHRTYGLIAGRASIPFGLFTATMTAGEYGRAEVEQGDYVIIACPGNLSDYKKVGTQVGVDDPNWGSGEIFKNLILMRDKKGKKSPGKSKKVTGSELLIIEPEYVEWTSSEELYPFAFESIGDWGVDVSVEPPEGFVSDHSNLSTDVSSDLKAVQFTITDEGSKWEPTEVIYTVEHKKGKKKKIISEVKVKLSKKLAKEKGVDEWGEDEDEDE